MLDLLTISFVFLALTGVALLTHGVRGRRIDNHPWCRRCRFDLRGRWPGAAKCPECGAGLDVIGAVEIGQRRRRHVSFALGVLLLILCGIWLGQSVVTSLGPIDWMHYKPDWWVVSEAHSPDGGAADAALAELVKRIDAGGLSDARVFGLIEDGLKLQADESATWRTGWGDVIEAAWKNGSLSPDQILQYAQRAVNVQMVSEAPKVRRWEFARAGPQPTLLRAGSGDLTLQFQIGPATFGGIDLEPNPGEGASYGKLQSTNVPLMAKTFAVLPDPGEHELSITWHATLTPRLAPSMMKPTTSVAPAMWDVPLTTTITVLPPAPNAPELIIDEATTAALKDSIEVQAIGLRVPPRGMGTTSGIAEGGRIVMLVTVREAPISASMQIDAGEPPLVGVFGHGQRQLTVTQGMSYQGRLFIQPQGRAEPAQISAVIRPDANRGPGIALAQRTSEQIWYGKPIEINDIPVTWYDTADDPDVPEQWRSILRQGPGGGPLPGSYQEGTIRRRSADGP